MLAALLLLSLCASAVPRGENGNGTSLSHGPHEQTKQRERERSGERCERGKKEFA